MSGIVIQKTRIRKLENYLNSIKDGETLIVGFPVQQKHLAKLKELGFSDFDSGETVLPKISGPVSRFNANGKVFVHRDKEKETAYRVVEWTWAEFEGKERIEKTDWKDVPYQRYPRTLIAPPGVELSIALNGSDIFVLAPQVIYDSQSSSILHIINLFLEIFGEAHIFSENLDPIIPSNLRRLNWKILPPGVHPWERIKEATQFITRKLGDSKNKFFMLRLGLLADYKPDFIAIGEAGFFGYFVFGFLNKNLFIFENPTYGNATYVVRDNWKMLSTLTKAQLISGNLIEERVVHLKNWPEEMRKLMA
jgi:hypothetical protein